METPCGLALEVLRNGSSVERNARDSTTLPPLLDIDDVEENVVSPVLRLRQNTHWLKYASFDSLLSCAALGHQGKTTTRRLPYRFNVGFLPELEQVVPRFTASLWHCCRLPSTDLTPDYISSPALQILCTLQWDCFAVLCAGQKNTLRIQRCQNSAHLEQEQQAVTAKLLGHQINATISIYDFCRNLRDFQGHF